MTVSDKINEFYFRMSVNELRLMNGGDFYKGLSYNSVLYVNIIDQMEDCTASRIADVLSVTKSAVTIKINELERKGVVYREQSGADKRTRFIRLMPEMKKVFGLYDDAMAKIERKLKRLYNEEQLQLFCDVMQTVNTCDWNEVYHE